MVSPRGTLPIPSSHPRLSTAGHTRKSNINRSTIPIPSLTPSQLRLLSFTPCKNYGLTCVCREKHKGLKTYGSLYCYKFIIEIFQVNCIFIAQICFII